MCGIAGIVDFHGREVRSDHVRAMNNVQRHRGPDGEGIWTAHDSGTSIGLGHRRLAILDLRDCAAQPMHNTRCARDGRALPLVLLFNGEIYNFSELRAELVARGHQFTTEGDSEIILHLYEDSGPRMVERLRGMFAIALWDQHAQQLFCVRDRLGKKPFYYRYANGRFWFASEAKAILADADVPAEVSLPSIRAYLSLGYVPGEASAFEGLRRLKPGHTLTVDRKGVTQHRYWELEYQPKRHVSEDEAVREIRHRLRESTRMRLISDVPLGAFLSGGTDSSAVVALMSEASAHVRTFSIGFQEEAFDELQYARAVAERFGTEHHEFVVRPDAVAIAPTLAWHYGEPFADSSAIPTYYLAKLARGHITVALNGDGGDESFGGYRRYQAHAAAAWYARIPAGARRVIENALNAFPSAASSRSRLYDVQRFIGGGSLAEEVRYASWFGFFSNHASWLHDSFAESTAGEGLDILHRLLASGRALHPVDAAMRTDVSLYLPDDLLVKVDIATMAHGLEARSPLLDHTLMEFVARLPVSVKMRRLQKKYLLRKACRDLVTPEIMSRPKMGFGVPLDRWFRHELGDYARDVLLSRNSRVRDYMKLDAVTRLFNEHQKGLAAHGHRLWALLMLELWHRECLNRRAAALEPR
jgi:asparagine synthase (glutamine-hydrolysing)